MQWSRYEKDVTIIAKKLFNELHKQKNMKPQDWIRSKSSLERTMHFKPIKKDYLAESFVRNAHQFKTEIIETVVSKLESFSPRKKKADQRRQTLLEYKAYLIRILSLRQSRQHGWVLPGVQLAKQDGSVITDADVFAVCQLKKGGTWKVILEECSESTGATKKSEAQKQLAQAIHCIRTRFPSRALPVETLFNGADLPL